MTVPRLIEGGLAIDDRGEVGFINGFNFDKVKRFYWISNHRAGFIRAWHGHKRECKFITVVQGSAIVAAVKIDNWENPSKEASISRFVLSSKKPSILCIPAGFANGFMNLTKDTKLLVFSTLDIEEAKGDDFRFDVRYWDPWQVVER